MSQLTEFKSYPKIERIGKMFMQITQKIHGTNAQVYIFETESGLELLCGSRTRWITPEDDNYGFARFVHENKTEFIEKLGVGQHFGEWAGYGINNGEGLKEKIFVLFDFFRYTDDLPKNCIKVPVLYSGPVDFSKIEELSNELKQQGSKICPGFMRVEGMVINISGTRYKKIFEAEETAWTQGDKIYQKDKSDEKQQITLKYGHLFQPIRLEKLLSKDERYLKEFPVSLKRICEHYFEDLIQEDQLPKMSDPTAVYKEMSGALFKFVRISVEANATL